MIELAPENTTTGALERVMLAETRAPSATSYDAADSLKAMRYMRQVIENRLKLEHRYGAPIGARTEIDVISVGPQFEGFGQYPRLREGIAKNIRESLRIANTPSDRRSMDYRAFIANAITAATETAPPAQARISANVVTWKTKGADAPGSNFVLVGSAQGNDFYAAVTEPKRRSTGPRL